MFKRLFGRYVEEYTTSGNLIEQNKRAVSTENLKAAREISFASLILTAMLTLLSLFSDEWRPLLPVYAVGVGVSLLVFLASVLILPNRRRLLLPTVYLFYTAFLALAAASDIIESPLGCSPLLLAIVFFVLPTTIIDRPVRVNTFSLVYASAFCLSAAIFARKTSFAGIVSCLALMLLGIMLGNDFRTTKLSEINNRRIIERQRDFDVLTGLPNRRKLFETLGRLTEKGPGACGLMMLDIDNFKNYNDTYGHQKGDECLTQLGAALVADAAEEHIRIFRFGGEEFLVLAPGRSYEETAKLAENIRLRIKNLALPYPAQPEGVVTMSIGYTASKDGAEGFERLITEADMSLYGAKALGKDITLGFYEFRSTITVLPDLPSRIRHKN